MQKEFKKTEWKLWFERANAMDDNVVLIPLSNKSRVKFNVEAALKEFRSLEGIPYGSHNMFLGWIDTPEDNFPYPLDSHLLMVAMAFASDYVEINSYHDFWAQAMNHRVNTKGLSVRQVYGVAASRNISFTQLITIPESDSWVYQNQEFNRTGPSCVCDVFVSRMWKAGGLFDPYASQINVAEFTDLDAYELDFFNSSYVRPKMCVEADPDLPFCQLIGAYRVNLPNYNIKKVFPHMGENCPGLPPKYTRPLNC